MGNNLKTTEVNSNAWIICFVVIYSHMLTYSC